MTRLEWIKISWEPKISKMVYRFVLPIFYFNQNIIYLHQQFRSIVSQKA